MPIWQKKERTKTNASWEVGNLIPGQWEPRAPWHCPQHHPQSWVELLGLGGWPGVGAPGTFSCFVLM